MEAPEYSLAWKMVESYSFACADFRTASKLKNEIGMARADGRMMGIKECLAAITGRTIATSLINKELSILEKVHSR